MHKVGQVGLDLVTTIIVGDVSPLEWRALSYGLTSWCLFRSWLYHALIVCSQRSRPIHHQLLCWYVGSNVNVAGVLT